MVRFHTDDSLKPKGENMETKLKATPGPWELHESGAIVGPKIDDKPIWLRPVIARFETGVKREDAALMAAAPDLLDALETLTEHFEYYMGDNECRPLENARAAIAKARGE